MDFPSTARPTTDHPKTVVEQFLLQYAEQETTYADLADAAKQIMQDAIKDTTLTPPPLCTARGKTSASLRRKLVARNANVNQGHGYRNMQDIQRDVSDLAGIRVLVYFPSHFDAVDALLRLRFDDVVRKPDSATYQARIYRVRVKAEERDRVGVEEALGRVEVQVVSLLMHAWAEVEHGEYKGLVESSEREKEMLGRLKDLVLEGEAVLGELYNLSSARD